MKSGEKRKAEMTSKNNGENGASNKQ